MQPLELNQVWLASFSSSDVAKKIGEKLTRTLGFEHHYQLARLAMGRALAEATLPTAADARGHNIKGNQLFGGEQEGGLTWVALFVERIQQLKPEQPITLTELQSIVRDHWSYGIELLAADWREANERYERFIELLVDRAHWPRANGVDSAQGVSEDKTQEGAIPASPHPIWLELGHNVQTQAPARWLLNGRGYAPNVAIMGQAGSGKTQMMLNLLKQLRTATHAPILLIDAGKDELADKPDLAKALGARVLKVPKEPIPLDMFSGSANDQESARDVAMAFCASLDKALKDGLTDNQKPRVVDALKPLLAQRQQISLSAIQTTLKQHYADNGIKDDRVLASLSMMNQYTLFAPELSPAEFFSQSWVLALGGAPDESRKLALFLLFDALHRYLQTLPEAPLDAEGHRAVHLAVAIDEARPLLAAKHDGLSKLVRLHRSHGLAVLLASQSPDDYAGQSDDYMEQIGLPICFRTNATSTAVLNNMFKDRKGVNFSALESGHCLTVLEGAKVQCKTF